MVPLPLRLLLLPGEGFLLLSLDVVVETDVAERRVGLGVLRLGITRLGVVGLGVARLGDDGLLGAGRLERRVVVLQLQQVAEVQLGGGGQQRVGRRHGDHHAVDVQPVVLGAVLPLVVVVRLVAVRGRRRRRRRQQCQHGRLQHSPVVDHRAARSSLH